MLSPSKVKFRKIQKGRVGSIANRGVKLAFGEYGLKALEAGKISAQEIEAARIAINRFVRRKGKLWIRVFPDKPISKKPAEVRMGSGKGPHDHWAAVIRPGKILYEMEGVDEDSAREAMRLASYKLSIATKFVSRSEELL